MGYLENTVGYSADELGVTPQQEKILVSLIEEFDMKAMENPFFSFIVLEDSFYAPSDFIDSWDHIITNIEDLMDSFTPVSVQEANEIIELGFAELGPVTSVREILGLHDSWEHLLGLAHKIQQTLKGEKV